MSTHSSRPDRVEFLQGTLEVLILRSLQLAPNHAYGISQFLRDESEGQFVVDNGSLYPALQRLLQRRFVKTHWKNSPSGRRAKYYELTRAGRSYVAEATAKWRRFAGAMEQVLGSEG